MSEKFYNLPKVLTFIDYEECVESVKTAAASNPDIRALYLMGGVWQPGISDMDIVVVYKNTSPESYLINPWVLSKKAEFIFTHRYLSFDEETARLFYFLYPKKIVNLRLIAGEPIDFAEPTGEEEIKWTTAFVLFDVIINKLLLFPRHKIGPVNVRNLIGELYSLVYNIEVTKDLTGEDISDGFVGKIKKLKFNWFDKSEEDNLEELAELLEEGLGVVWRNVESLNRFLVKEKVVGNAQLVFADDKYRLSFSDNWTSDLALREFRKSILGTVPVINKKIESYRLILPTAFGFFFESYAVGVGKFSNTIAEHLSGLNRLQIPIGANNHLKAMNTAFNASVKTAGNFKIPFSFGLPLFKKSLKNRLFWLLVKFIRVMKK